MGRMEDDDGVGMGESDEEAQHRNGYTSGDDDDDSEFDEAIPLNENGRLRMRSDINMGGPDYAGKKSSRFAVFESTDEEKLQKAPVDDEDDDDEDDVKRQVPAMLRWLMILNSINKLLVEFLESSNPGGLGGIQRR